MTLKDPQVHAMASQLVARRVTAVSDATRQALAAKLERSAHGPDRPAQIQKPRREELERLRLLSFRRLRWPDQRSTELYNEHGLPI